MEGNVKGRILSFLLCFLFGRGPWDPLTSLNVDPKQHLSTRLLLVQFCHASELRFAGPWGVPDSATHGAELFGASTLKVSKFKACLPAHPSASAC